MPPWGDFQTNGECSLLLKTLKPVVNLTFSSSQDLLVANS
jgi:hypothetical protein